MSGYLRQAADAMDSPTEQPLDTGSASISGSVIGVISGCGGAGGSVLAAVLAGCAAASRTGPVVLLDCDPLGGGIDVLLGRERQPGVRWSDVRTRGGTIDPAALLQLLPQWNGVSYLAADSPAALDPDAVAAVITAAVRAGRVVIDLPRWPSAFRASALRACNSVLLVTPAEVRSVTSSAGVAAALDPARSAVVIRGAARALPVERIGALLGLPVAGRLPFDPALDGSRELQISAMRRATRRMAAGLLDQDGLATDAA